MPNRHITAFAHIVIPEQRYRRNKHRGAVVWLTGLSGAGKSTIAMHTEFMLCNAGYQSYVLDGDNLRHGLNSDLGFSPEDRAENIRRVAEVATMFGDAGLITITSLISPSARDRENARAIARNCTFLEVYVKADIETCKRRDPKGLYRKALSGQITGFTGISSPYEAPQKPAMVIDTEQFGLTHACAKLVNLIRTHVDYPAEPCDRQAKDRF